MGASRAPTAIVMLNMGGPATLDKVPSFLGNLFSDPDIIPLGKLQSKIGPWYGSKRAPKIQKQYDAIGGGSPIRKWTEIQGSSMCDLLDTISPKTAPHKSYTAFRYSDPLTEDCLRSMKMDGVKRAVAFSQYPQWSCTTSGSSMNQIWRELRRLNMGKDFEWSLIDRWSHHPGYVKAMAACVKRGLEKFEKEDRKKVVILFSAHSVPMKVVNKGDPYTMEIAASVERVMDSVGRTNAHMLAWQSKVGFLPWMGPSVSEVLKGLGRQGHQHVLAVPIAFMSDHIETLYEIDIEYAEEAREANITEFHRAPALNDQPLVIEAMANLVKDHIALGELHSPNYPLNCSGCENPMCRLIMNPIKPYGRLRDVAQGIETPQDVDELLP